MDRYAKLVDVLRRGIVPTASLPILSAEVVAITGESCTVLIGELELTEVRLKATINGGTNKLLVTPKVGSMVLVGSLTGDMKDLAVLAADEVEKLEYQQDGMAVSIDSVSGKVAVSNGTTSLKDIFSGLADLLKKFKVATPAGPSTSVLPDTLLAIQQFETSFNQLLN